MGFRIFLCFFSLTQLKSLPAESASGEAIDTQFILTEPKRITYFIITATPQFLTKEILFNFPDIRRVQSTLGEKGVEPTHNSSFSKALTSVASEDTTKMISDNWFALDKIYHLIVSFSLVGSGYHLLANRIGLEKSYATSGSIGSVLALGVSKELFDASRPNDRFSYRDLIYDILGIGIGYFVFIH